MRFLWFRVSVSDGVRWWNARAEFVDDFKIQEIPHLVRVRLRLVHWTDILDDIFSTRNMVPQEEPCIYMYVYVLCVCVCTCTGTCISARSKYYQSYYHLVEY